MGIRTLEVGFDKHIKTFATQAKATLKAEQCAALCHGLVNVRIVPQAEAVDGQWSVRWTAIFSNFGDQSDIMVVIGYGFLCHS